MVSPNLKNLRIQSSALKRTYKELSSYKKELSIEQKRLVTMKEDPSTEKLRIRQQKDVVEECRVMIPNTKQRLDKAVKTVKDLFSKLREQASGDLETLESEKQYVEAKEILDQVLEEFPEYNDEKDQKEKPTVD